MIKKIPLYQPSLSKSEKNNVVNCINENWISSKGRFIKKFEDNFKKKFKYKYATVTTNGTTALHLAVMSLGLKKGDEVIVPNLTYVAPCNAVTYSGAKVVLADVNLDTWLVDKNTILTDNQYRFKNVRELLKRLDFEIIIVDLKKMWKYGGSIRCLTQPLIRENC